MDDSGPTIAWRADVDGGRQAAVRWPSMGFEVELKFRAPDRAALLSRLGALGARSEASVEQEDVYLAHPCRDFAQTNEAFRVRRVGPSHRVTYKGPKHPGETKTREEIEIPFSADERDFAALLRLLERLGFSPVATIRKTRLPFRVDYLGQELEVALDKAEEIGDFVEVETFADTPEALAAGQHAVMECARALGLSEVEPRSYLRMALERRASVGRNPAGET